MRKHECNEKEALIVFDEVQFCPTARQAIKKINMYPLDYEEFLWAIGDIKRSI